ncbi:MAG: immunoglobulin-like domain-containing protein, partial [Planctomycetota bacterium]
MVRAQYVEIEPNETKAQALANGVYVMSAGSTITGTTTGSVATTGALNSLDLLRIQTAPLPTGIYRHRLVPTSSTLLPTLSIIALNPASPALLQTAQLSILASTPPRLIQWYGFGRSEQLYIRLVGTLASTAPYTLTLVTDSVAAPDIPGAFAVGSIDISTIGLTTIDTEVHVFDQVLQELLDYQNDDPFAQTGFQCRLVRPFAAGTYYVAMGRYNLFSEFGTAGNAGGERTVSNSRMDFPGFIVASSAATVASNVTFSVTDSAARSQTVPATVTQPFDIEWFRMTVGDGGGCTAAAITASPTDLELCFGNTATLTVHATGSAPLFHQWFFNGNPIPGAIAPSLQLPNVDFSFAGVYACQVTNACGNATSTPATVTVHPAGPEIVDDPDPATLCPGELASFAVAALPRMQGALTYQWFKNGQPIPGADASTLSFPVVDLTDGGQYLCRVTELGCGSADSSAALLTVRNAAPVITLLGAATVTLECGIGTYVEAGATVADDCNVGLPVTIGGDVVPVHEEGHYVVTYDAVDAQGNHATQVQRHVYVVDTVRPTVQVSLATSVLW